MADELAIGLDIGTTGCKAVAITQLGGVAASADRTYPLITPEPGAAEQNPELIRQAAFETLRELSEKLGGHEVKALSTSGAMHSVIAIDDTGSPLTNAMTWADTRPAEICDQLRESLDKQTLSDLRTATGCPLRWTYHAPRLRWLKLHRPEVFANAARFVSITEYVTHALTGRWMCDSSLASTTGLLDTHKSTWHADMLELAGVEANRLGKVVASVAPIGEMTKEASNATGLPTSMIVVAGGSDGPLANLGSGASKPNDVAISVGTSGAVRVVFDRPYVDHNGGLWCYQLYPGRWVAGGAINNAGLAINWVCKRFYLNDRDANDAEQAAAFATMMREASTIAPGAEGVSFLPWFTGERNPHWQPHATAGIAGLTLNHTRAHIARAALEAIGFCLADVFESLPRGTSKDPQPRITGGITNSPAWLQIVADVLGCNLRPTESPNASAIGAAALAWAGITGEEPTTYVRSTLEPVRQINHDADAYTLYHDVRLTFKELSQISGIK